jgi:dTDP-4-amino-4,6-dideoxygalactose transaminase
MTSRYIPFLDLIAPHIEMEEALIEVFRTTLQNAAFVGGEAVNDFEKAFAGFCGANYCVGVGSGTDALRCALIAAGIGRDQSVLTVPNSFIATTEAISQTSALPEFVDIDEATYNIDPEKIRNYLVAQCHRDPLTGRPVSRRTSRVLSAIIPVHLYGQMADMDAIMAIADEWNLLVIEDACQAHGAEYYSRTAECWRKAGSVGHAAAFSFYPGKNLGACGEAGAVTTDDAALAMKVSMLRDHGQAQKYYHDVEGYNCRLDTIQAGLLLAKLIHLREWNAVRRQRAESYQGMLSAIESLTLPYEPEWSKAVYHLYVVRARNRDDVQRYLKDAGIGTGIHYPVPLHLQKAYAYLGYQRGDFPVTEKVASEILSLPMYPQLSCADQQVIAETVRQCLGESTIAPTL